jgi:hypothetical protein
MATALLAGLPNRYLSRVKAVLAAARAELENWEFIYLVSPKGPDLQIRDRKRIYTEAERRGSLHVLGFSGERNRDNVAAAIRQYFRFRWFDHSMLPLLDTPDPSRFVSALSSTLSEELAWAEQIMPSSSSDALLLPQPCFRCSGTHSRMWSKAEAYGSTDSVQAADRAIGDFEREYNQRIQFQTRGHALRLQNKWMDDRRIVFDENGARHGIAPAPRAWKYSYRIEDGFHYDVSKQNRDEFTITDADGESHRVEKNWYINIEIHGHVR